MLDKVCKIFDNIRHSLENTSLLTSDIIKFIILFIENSFENRKDNNNYEYINICMHIYISSKCYVFIISPFSILVVIL